MWAKVLAQCYVYEMFRRQNSKFEPETVIYSKCPFLTPTIMLVSFPIMKRYLNQKKRKKIGWVLRSTLWSDYMIASTPGLLRASQPSGGTFPGGCHWMRGLGCADRQRREGDFAICAFHVHVFMVKQQMSPLLTNLIPEVNLNWT